MTLKASKLKEIPQRNIDLAFGYLKQKEQEHKANYPQLIKYLVLIYSNAQDKFDPNTTNKDLNIIQHTIRNSWPYENDLVRKSYLENVVSNGIHIWNFEYHVQLNEHAFSQVGIWKTNSGEPNVDESDIDDTNDNNSCTEYAITMNGHKTNPGNPSSFDKERYPELKTDDIIEMRLDLNELTLSFKVNGKDHCQFRNIENAEYRAVVALFQAGDGFTLTSYQDSYN